MITDFEQEVIERLTRIEEGVAGLYSSKADHETRLRSVETKTTLVSGALAIVAPVLGWLGVHITLH